MHGPLRLVAATTAAVGLAGVALSPLVPAAYASDLGLELVPVADQDATAPIITAGV